MLSTTVAQRTNVWADKEFLKVASYFLGAADKVGQTTSVPQNVGKVVKFRRWEKLDISAGASSFALQEGTTPAGQNLTNTDYTATLDQYGNFIRTTDVIKLTYEDKMFPVYNERLAQQAAELSDLVTFGGISGGTNQYYGDGGSETSVATISSIATVTTLNKIRANLEYYRAIKLMPKATATNQVATQGLLPAYVGFVHTDLTTDLYALSGFIKTSAYPSGTEIWAGEIGSLGHIRFVDASLGLAPQLGAGAATVAHIQTNGLNDVYQILIVGKDSYGVVPLAGMGSAQIIVKDIGSSGTDDPLNQRGTIGFKFWKTAVILNDNWMASYYVARGAY